MDEEVEGFRVVAQALARLGVKYMFGVVGIPVVEVGAALQHCSTAGKLLMLPKIASELHPKVRNHGEGPY